MHCHDTYTIRRDWKCAVYYQFHCMEIKFRLGDNECKITGGPALACRLACPCSPLAAGSASLCSTDPWPATADTFNKTTWKKYLKIALPFAQFVVAITYVLLSSHLTSIIARGNFIYLLVILQQVRKVSIVNDVHPLCYLHCNLKRILFMMYRV